MSFMVRFFLKRSSFCHFNFSHRICLPELPIIVLLILPCPLQWLLLPRPRQRCLSWIADLSDAPPNSFSGNFLRCHQSRIHNLWDAIIEVPHLLPENYAIANATQCTGPTKDDFKAMLDYKTLLFADCLTRWWIRFRFLSCGWPPWIQLTRKTFSRFWKLDDEAGGTGAGRGHGIGAGRERRPNTRLATQGCECDWERTKTCPAWNATFGDYTWIWFMLSEVCTSFWPIIIVYLFKIELATSSCLPWFMTRLVGQAWDEPKVSDGTKFLKWTSGACAWLWKKYDSDGLLHCLLIRSERWNGSVLIMIVQPRSLAPHPYIAPNTANKWRQRLQKRSRWWHGTAATSLVSLFFKILLFLLYLLSLPEGLSKSFMAGVSVAGPLSGLIVQPLIGT